MKIMQLHGTYLCSAFALLATALPNNAADRAKSAVPQKQNHLGLLGKEATFHFLGNIQAPPGLQPTQEEVEGQRLRALKGSGGGLNKLHHDEKEGEVRLANSIYRPWKTRFDLHPYNLDDPDLLKPENRMGYRHFYAANPNLALAPNSRDRQTQSTVEMIFGLTALASVICGVIIVHEMSVLETENLKLIEYQNLMTRVVILAALPWMALGVWLFTVFVAGMVTPMRDPKMVYNWQCSAMSGFLLVAPLINTAYFAVHALWLSRLFFTLDRQVSAPMGRMFGLTSEMQKLANSDWLTHVLNVATDSCTRYMLLFLEAACALFGYMLITFRWGANSQFCHPEVYWATTALVVTVAIIIVFSFLTFLSSLFIGAYSTSPWVQDFVRSFWDARLLAKAAKHEQAEKAAAAAHRKENNEANYEAEFNAWAADYDQEMADECRKHQASLDLHARYLEEVSQATPRHPKDFPLVDELDNTLEPPSNITLFASRTSVISPPPNVTLFDPPTSYIGYIAGTPLVSTPPAGFPCGVSMGGSVKPSSPDRVFLSTPEVPVGNGYLGSVSEEAPCNFQSFAKPFGQK